MYQYFFEGNILHFLIKKARTVQHILNFSNASIASALSEFKKAINK